MIISMSPTATEDDIKGVLKRLEDDGWGGEVIQGSQRVVIGVVAIIAGTALVAWGAPDHSETHRGAAAVIGVMAALVLASLVPFPLRGTRFDTALMPNLASACGFAATNVAAKLMSDDKFDMGDRIPCDGRFAARIYCVCVVAGQGADSEGRDICICESDRSGAAGRADLE